MDDAISIVDVLEILNAMEADGITAATEWFNMIIEEEDETRRQELAEEVYQTLIWRYLAGSEIGDVQ